MAPRQGSSPSKMDDNGTSNHLLLCSCSHSNDKKATNYILPRQSNVSLVMPEEQQVIWDPDEETDVCFGRGKGIYRRPANMTFQAIVVGYKPRYQQCQEHSGEKTAMIHALWTELVERRGIRFLKQRPGGGWLVATKIQVLKKIAHALRTSNEAKAAKEYREEMLQNFDERRLSGQESIPPSFSRQAGNLGAPAIKELWRHARTEAHEASLQSKASRSESHERLAGEKKPPAQGKRSRQDKGEDHDESSTKPSDRSTALPNDTRDRTRPAASSAAFEQLIHQHNLSHQTNSAAMPMYAPYNLAPWTVSYEPAPWGVASEHAPWTPPRFSSTLPPSFPTWTPMSSPVPLMPVLGSANGIVHSPDQHSRGSDDEAEAQV